MAYLKYMHDLHKIYENVFVTLVWTKTQQFVVKIKKKGYKY